MVNLNIGSGNGNVFLKIENISAKLAKNLHDTVLDLLEVASYVYCADQAVSRGGMTIRSNGEDWRRRFHIAIPVRLPDLWNSSEIKSALEETLGFLSDDHYDFKFTKLTSPSLVEQYFPFDNNAPWFKADTIALFSAGLDSLAGAVDEIVLQGMKPVLVSHRPVAKISTWQTNLLKAFSEELNFKQQFLHVPVWVNKYSGLTHDTSQRSRSFLYGMLGAALAIMQELDEVRFYENGIISSNLPFSDQVVGSRATRSTHPKALKGFSKLVSVLVGKDFKFQNPYFWKTKSEVVQIIKSAGMEKLIGFSRSCSHVRTAENISTHCGVCSQCVDRRIATAYNDLSAHDPAESYKIDLFSGRLEKTEDRTMVESIIRIAAEIEKMDDAAFFGRFPEATRIITHLDMSPSQAAKGLYDLYKRYSAQVGAVVENQIHKHVPQIRKGEVPPNSLVGMLLPKRTKSKGLGASGKRFLMPDGARWEDIRITIVAKHTVRIAVKDKIGRFTAFDMGFRDDRRTDMPTVLWETLEELAEGKGILSWNRTGTTLPNLSKRMELLGKTLQVFFGLSEKPFTRYQKKSGYTSRFRISWE